MAKVGASTHKPINPSTNTRKIIKLRVDVSRYEHGYINANITVSASVYAHGNDNVFGCTDMCT